MTKVRVVCVIVDERRLTIYQDDGEKLFIPQGDPRVRQIVDEVLPIVNKGGVAEIDLGLETHYEEFEEKTGGLVRFFRVAKSKVASFFARKNQEETEFILPGSFGDTDKAMASAVEEIITNAKPARSSVNENETVVAVVGDKMIPGVEQLRGQLKHSKITGSTIGLQRLMERMAAMVALRDHSVEDILRFMEKSDLPVCDDGSIIGYKMLKTNDTLTGFVDPHTKKVPQNVGSVVMVDESMVDRNRRNECSNGLHVARRGYLSGFRQDACFLVKVAPEDIITVPHGDPSKVRVCRYHIVSRLDDAAFHKVSADKSMTDDEAMQKLLGRIVAGDHIGIVEEVRITKPYGEGIIVTPRFKDPEVKTFDEIIPVQSIEDDTGSTGAPSVDPRALSKEIAETKAASEPEPVRKNSKMKPLSRKELGSHFASILLSTDLTKDQRASAASELRKLKKTSKVSWEKLGVSPAVVKLLDGIKPVEATPASAKDKAPVPAKKFSDSMKDAAVKATEPREQEPVAKLSRKEKALNLLVEAVLHGDIASAKELMKLKKTSKVSWARLGIDQSEADTIEKLAA